MTPVRRRSRGSALKNLSTRSRRRPRTRSLRRLAERARSPAASRMPILTAPRPISRSTRSANQASAARDAVIANGGTVTHHHAVGRDHRPWYDRQRPPLFAEALRAAKKALDPQGLLNPGVLIDP